MAKSTVNIHIGLKQYVAVFIPGMTKGVSMSRPMLLKNLTKPCSCPLAGGHHGVLRLQQTQEEAMTREEFINLAMTGNETIPQVLYDQIEYFYMSDNDYHAHHGGVDEDKHHFVARVFGGKINTPRTILAKLVKEASRENRWALRGNSKITLQRLRSMDRVILFHHRWMIQ